MTYLSYINVNLKIYDLNYNFSTINIFQQTNDYLIVTASSKRSICSSNNKCRILSSRWNLQKRMNNSNFYSSYNTILFKNQWNLQLVISLRFETYVNCFVDEISNLLFPVIIHVNRRRPNQTEGNNSYGLWRTLAITNWKLIEMIYSNWAAYSSKLMALEEFNLHKVW